MMQKRVNLPAVFMTLLLLAAHLSVARAQQPTLDFRLLYYAAQLADQAYDGKSEIFGELSGDRAWAATPGDANVQYVFNHNPERRVQIIAVRGTVDKINMALNRDTRAAFDRKAGILIHNGFAIAARGIYRHVRTKLKPGYKTYLTGHSLGGAVAAILGMYFLKDGIDVGGIVTFGQPKFTDAAGADVYRSLPLLRVVYQNDIVSILPVTSKRKRVRFAHVGAAINVLSGPYYVYGTADQALDFSLRSVRRKLRLASLPDHKMKWYLHGLKEKLNKAVRVRFADRIKYIIRHKSGADSFVNTPAKRKFNFNQPK